MWVTQAQLTFPLGICLFPTIQPSRRSNDGDAFQLEKSVHITYKKEKIVGKVLDQDTMYFGGVMWKGLLSFRSDGSVSSPGPKIGFV